MTAPSVQNVFHPPGGTAGGLPVGPEAWCL